MKIKINGKKCGEKISRKYCWCPHTITRVQRIQSWKTRTEMKSTLYYSIFPFSLSHPFRIFCKTNEFICCKKEPVQFTCNKVPQPNRANRKLTKNLYTFQNAQEKKNSNNEMEKKNKKRSRDNCGLNIHIIQTNKNIPIGLRGVLALDVEWSEKKFYHFAGGGILKTPITAHK